MFVSVIISINVFIKTGIICIQGAQKALGQNCKINLNTGGIFFLSILKFVYVDKRFIYKVYIKFRRGQLILV